MISTVWIMHRQQTRIYWALNDLQLNSTKFYIDYLVGRKTASLIPYVQGSGADRELWLNIDLNIAKGCSWACAEVVVVAASVPAKHHLLTRI